MAPLDAGVPQWTCSAGTYPNGDVGTSVTWRAPSTPAVVEIALGEEDLPLPIPPQPEAEGFRDDSGGRWVDYRTINAVGVSYIAYNDPDLGWIGMDTLYVLKDTQVQFKAIKAPSGANWPSGKPVWGGSS